MTRAEGIAKLLAEHELLEHSAGNGHTEPQEHWATCECGAFLGAWQQFYEETDYDPERDFRKHLAAVVDAWLAGQGEPPEIRHVTLDNGETVLDEVVARDASVHLEAMADNAWWLGIESGGQLVHVNLTTKRAKIDGTAEVD